MLCAGAAHAVALAPGGAVATPGTTSALRPELAGVVQVDPITHFSYSYVGGGLAFEGNLQGRVYISDTLNTVVFAPRLREFTGDTTGWGLVSMTIAGYGGWSCDVDYRIDGDGDVGSSGASRSAMPGDLVKFDFSTPVMVGQESKFVFNLTDAPGFAAQKGAIELYFENAQKLTHTVVLDYYVPLPEPATVGFLTLGGLALLRRRRA